MAEKYLSESIALNSADDKQQYVKFELGKLYFSQGNYDLAYPYFKEIEGFFNRTDKEYYSSILFFLGFIHYYLENINESSTYFDLILKISKDKKRKASAFYGMAYIAYKVKNYLNVISLCENTITQDPDFFDKESIGFLTAASYFHLGRIDIFNAYYYQLVKNYPNGRYHAELEKLYQSPANTKN
jgi:tetratricopeptide (TPR) repeat protein